MPLNGLEYKDGGVGGTERTCPLHLKNYPNVVAICSAEQVNLTVPIVARCQGKTEFGLCARWNGNRGGGVWRAVGA
jgi:hypothetical protein